MKVAELIERLRQFPLDADVIVPDDGYTHYSHIRDVAGPNEHPDAPPLLKTVLIGPGERFQT